MLGGLGSGVGQGAGDVGGSALASDGALGQGAVKDDHEGLGETVVGDDSEQRVETFKRIARAVFGFDSEPRDSRLVEYLHRYPLHLEEILVVGDKVVIRSVARATHTGPLAPGAPVSGKAVSFNALEIHRFEGQQIAQSWHIQDYYALMAQIGAIDNVMGRRCRPLPRLELPANGTNPPPLNLVRSSTMT